VTTPVKEDEVPRAQLRSLDRSLAPTGNYSLPTRPSKADDDDGEPTASRYKWRPRTGAAPAAELTSGRIYSDGAESSRGRTRHFGPAYVTSSSAG